ncbi:hypothetical protein HWV62_41122 [Athelia sp. TMB]|nr:hypothetical protein HWV62_41122 [Athelia sp. TMB]
MKGIISTLSFCPSASAFYAAGTLTPTPAPIALYDGAVDEPVIYLGLGDSERKRHGGGVTQLRFNPIKPHLLYGSFRRCGHIYAWDVRQAAGEPVYKYRFANSDSESGTKMTNQRLRFDVDIGGRWLSVGNQDGEISMFDLDSEGEPGGTECPQGIPPSLTFKAHEDAIGSVSFHPLQPVLLSASGSRHFEAPFKTRAQQVSDSSDSDGEDLVGERPLPFPMDASVKLWAFKGD